MKNALESLYRSGLKFLVPLTPDETYRLLVREAKKIIGASHGTILVWEGGSLKRVYSTLPFPVVAIPRKDGYTAKTLSTEKPQVIQKKDLVAAHPEFQALRADMVVVVPLSYEKHLIGILYLTVIKKKKITKQELQMLQLYGAIASLSLRKTQLYQDAMTAITSQERLIELVAHELRTPLTTITAYVSFLEKRITQCGKAIPQWVKELSFSTTLLNKLVNNLLNVNVMQSEFTTYAMGKVSIAKVVKETLSKFSEDNPTAHISLLGTHPTRGPLVFGNKNKLEQALLHVLENAEKFSNKESPITVAVEKKKETYEIRVSDRGMGISRKDRQKIFLPFSKAHDNYHEGMGLGLFFTKSIIRQHNGKVSVHSQYKKGTEVTISLPIFYET